MKRTPIARTNNHWVCLITVLLLCSSKLSAAPIEVINSPGLFWQENLISNVNKIDRFLGDQFTGELSSVRIIRSYMSPEYDLARHQIYIDESYTPVELYHEYAHKVLDDMLIKRCAAIRYFNLRRSFEDRDPVQVLREVELEVADDVIYLQELKDLGYNKMAGNLARSIKNNQLKMQRIRDLLPEHQRYGALYSRYRGEEGELSLYQLIAPYHELFADSVSVLMTGSWNSTYVAQLDRLKRSGEELAFVKTHPKMSQQQFLEYRAFKQGLTLKEYQFSPMEQESSYTQFVPFRSHFRHLAESEYRGQPQQLLYKLAQLISDEIGQRLDSESLYRMSLPEMNGRLITGLN